MNATAVHYLLMAISMFGSYWAFQFIFKFFSASLQESGGALETITTRKTAETSAFEGLERRGSLLQRLDFFLVRTFHLEKSLEPLYMLLGRPEKPTAIMILHYQEMAAVIVPTVLYILLESWMAFLLTPVAFYLPYWYYKSKAAQRQQNILRHFPAFVDLSALTIESGQDYMSAFDKIVRTAVTRTDLEVEVDKTLGEVQLGYSRREALRRMALRTGLQDVRSFVGLIIQSDELGTSLVDLLRNFSSDMRFRRMNKAEKAAAQASTKMLIPIFFFIFPTVFILMLAPMLVNLFKGGLGF